MRVLAVVDGSERTGRVLKYLLELADVQAGLEVTLLNIQPQPQGWRMRGYGWFQREEIHDRLINDLGRKIVGTASRRLQGANIKHKHRIELGDQIDTIIRCSREERTDLLVVPEAEPGIVWRWLLRRAHLPIGSAASVIVHLIQVPVLVVK